MFGRDSIPRSLLESASFIMILYFPAIFQILSAVFQKCFISFNILFRRDEEFHLALTADDFDKAHALHEKMECICFENHDMGIYFINDPDGYWFEIIPTK